MSQELLSAEPQPDTEQIEAFISRWDRVSGSE
jgi:hypothetical protein